SAGGPPTADPVPALPAVARASAPRILPAVSGTQGMAASVRIAGGGAPWYAGRRVGMGCRQEGTGMPRRVIDADGHVGEPKDLFERYLDVPLGGRRPYLTKDDWGVDRWVIEGRLFPVPEGPGIGPKTRYDGFRPGMLDPRARLADMDVEGIDVASIFPSVANAFGWGIESPELGVAACRAYNNFILDYCGADPARLNAIATMPLQDPSAAAEEL